MRYCEEYAALLDGFVDGELTPEEMTRVQAHLAGCPGCQAYVDDALTIRAGFPDVEDTVVPEGFAGGVMERVREDAGRGAKVVELRRRNFRRWTGTLAALAACCALVIFVRTGPGGLNGGDSAAMVTAGSDAPADCAADTGAAEDESAIAPQMAMEPAAAPEAAMDPEEDAAEEKAAADMAPAGTRMAAASGGGAYDGEYESEKAASPEEYGDLPAAMRLTAEEAGDLLKDFTAAWETGAERAYELNAEEYRELLKALGRQEKLPEASEGPFLVVVTGPVE